MPPIDIEELISKINEKIKEAKEKWPFFVDRLRRANAEFFAQVQGLLTWVQDRLNEAWTTILRFVQQQGNPFILWQVGDDWMKLVGEPVGKQATALVEDKLRTDEEWAGTAANEYKKVLGQQEKAFVSVRDTADGIQDVLRDMALAIGKLWIGIYLGVWAFVATLATAIGVAATGVGAPAAVGLLVAAVGALGAIIKGVVDSLTEFVSGTVVPSIDALEDSYNAGMPEWPGPGSDISDGSFQKVDKNADEKRIKWHLQKA